mmetsp:Transcript_22151/g.36663  ORF Transcript_22151/g.36663 Transcript_22151/m.36663 type:complete len:373 (+) Transcript_22151:1912-3030(+)
MGTIVMNGPNHFIWISSNNASGGATCDSIENDLQSSTTHLLALFLSILVSLIGKPSLDNCHTILRQGTGLVRANIGGITHCFTSRQMSNEVLVSQHLLTRVSKCNGHGEGQSFWDSHNDNGHTDNKGIECMVKDSNVREIFRLHKNLDQHHGYKCRRSCSHTNITNQGSHMIQLFLQWSLFLFLLKVGLDDTPLTVLTNRNGEELCRPSSNGTSRENKRVDIVVLLNIHGLSGQGRFIHFKSIVLQQDSIAGNFITSFDADNITNNQLCNAHLLGLTRTHDHNVNLFIIDLRQVSKLRFLIVIIDRRHDTHNQDSSKNCNSLNVARGGVVIDTNYERNNSSCHENLKGGIVKGINKELPEGIAGRRGQRVRS